MSDAVTRGLFQALVARAGGVEPVAAVLEARFGTGHKGTVSKMAAGHIGVTVDAVVALEDFVGAAPITLRMFERLGRGDGPAASLRDLAMQAAVATGTAQAALVGALSDGVVTPAEAADVAARMRQLKEMIGDIVMLAERAARGQA